MERQEGLIPNLGTVSLQIPQKRTDDHPVLNAAPHSINASDDRVEPEHPGSDGGLIPDGLGGRIVPAKFPSPPPDSQLETMDQIRARMRALNQAEAVNDHLVQSLVMRRRRQDENFARRKGMENRKIREILDHQRRREVALVQARLRENEGFKSVEDQIEQEEKVLRRRLKVHKRNLLLNQCGQPRSEAPRTSPRAHSLTLPDATNAGTASDYIPLIQNGETSTERRTSIPEWQSATEKPPSPFSWFSQIQPSSANIVAGEDGGPNQDNLLPLSHASTIRSTKTSSPTSDIPSLANALESSVTTEEAQGHSTTDYATSRKGTSVQSCSNRDANCLLEGKTITSAEPVPPGRIEKPPPASGELGETLWLPQMYPTVYQRSASQPPALDSGTVFTGSFGCSGTTPQQSAPQTYSGAPSLRKWDKVQSAGPFAVTLAAHRYMSAEAGIAAMEHRNAKLEEARSNLAQKSQSNGTSGEFENASTGAVDSRGARLAARQDGSFADQPSNPGFPTGSISRSSGGCQVFNDQGGLALTSQVHTMPEVTTNECSEFTMTTPANKDDTETTAGKVAPARRPRGRPRKNTPGS